MTTGSQSSSSQQQSSQSSGNSIMTFSRWNLRDSNPTNVQSLANLARESRTLFQKYGATGFSACQLQTGQHAGQYVTIVTYPNWEAFGAAMNGIQRDEVYTKLQGDIQQIATLDGRSISSEIALPN